MKLVGMGACALFAVASLPGCDRPLAAPSALDAAIDRAGQELWPALGAAAPAQVPSARRVASGSSAATPPAAPWKGARRPEDLSVAPGPVRPAHALADWMRDAATPAYRSGDLETIAEAFEQMVAWAPPGFDHWKSIAIDGADAARAGSVEGVKAACRGCHTQYGARYKAERRSLPPP